MTDHDVAPDGIVRTALQLLPIPPHGDAFWSRLETALDAEEPLVLPVDPVRRPLVAVATPDEPELDESEPSHDVAELEAAGSLALVPHTFRRTSNALLGVVAAAAVVVVAIAGNRLIEDRAGTEVSSDSPSADAALETLVNDAKPQSATLTTLSDAHEDATSEAVLAWVEDLGTGDAEGAWSAMGDASRAHFGSRAEFQGTMTDLAEGYGAWSAAQPDEVLVTPVLAGEDGTIAVVTLIGTVEQEGTEQERTDAFPVRIIDGDVILEPFASAGALEVVIPEAVSDDGLERASVGTLEELVFVLPSSAEAPVLRIDGSDTVICGEADGTELSDLDQSPGQRCAYLPEGGFSPGAHIITVAFLGPDGASITAETLRFEAA